MGSSTKANGLVDKHDIESALEAWTLYWVALEGFVILAVCALTSALAASAWLLTLFWPISMGFLLFMHFRYAKLQDRTPDSTDRRQHRGEHCKPPSIRGELMRYKIGKDIIIRSENAAKPEAQSSTYLNKLIAQLKPVHSSFDFGCGKLRYERAIAKTTDELALVDSEV